METINSSQMSLLSQSENKEEMHISATNRGSKRSEADFYATPIPVIEKFLKYHEIKEGSILEPCAGNGNIIRALHRKVTAVELREEECNNLQQMADEVIIADYLKWKPDRQYKTIITNPPYTYAMEFIKKSFEVVESGGEVIMLLRLAFLESKKRHDFWQQYPVNKLYILSERPSFTGKGTDATAYAWFVWDGTDRQQIEVI